MAEVDQRTICSINHSHAPRKALFEVHGRRTFSGGKSGQLRLAGWFKVGHL